MVFSTVRLVVLVRDACAAKLKVENVVVMAARDRRLLPTYIDGVWTRYSGRGVDVTAGLRTVWWLARGTVLRYGTSTIVYLHPSRPASILYYYTDPSREITMNTTNFLS